MELPEPKLWKPEIHARWFHIEADGHIACDEWGDAPDDQARWKIGNCFKTRAEAEQAREKMKVVLLNFHNLLDSWYDSIYGSKRPMYPP